MDYYVIQLLTGKEDIFLKFAKNSFSGQDISFFWLRKELFIKKFGISRKTISSVFPGYIFIEAEKISYEITES
jgi:hypothetical protein